MKMDQLVKPKSIALVGFSADSSRIGGRIYQNLRFHGYGGKIYLINPKYGFVEGNRCYKSINEIPDNVDVALIALPAQQVGKVLKDVGKRGIKAAIVFSSGFAEVGGDGPEKQRELTEIAKEFDIALCGPNCVG